MPSLTLTAAFNRFGAKLVNPQWAVSAMNKDGELVVSCWTHHLKARDGTLRYEDRLSRWDGNKAGNNLLREHLNAAVDGGIDVRLVTARTDKTELVDSGEDASQVEKSFGVRDDVIGKVILFDGDEFVIEFVRAEN